VTGLALKVPEPYAGKLARTVLRGRKLPGATRLSLEADIKEMIKNLNNETHYLRKLTKS